MPVSASVVQRGRNNFCIWMNPPFGRTIGKWVEKAPELFELVDIIATDEVPNADERQRARDLINYINGDITHA